MQIIRDIRLFDQEMRRRNPSSTNVLRRRKPHCAGVAPDEEVIVMRNFMLREARSRNELVPAIRRLFDNWKARRALMRMRDLDDRMLRDIGVNRIDLETAISLPWSENAVLYLERSSFASGRCRIYEVARQRAGAVLGPDCGLSPAAATPSPH
jgi:uncharacterized protein YjiS (DUF1127 family)